MLRTIKKYAIHYIVASIMVSLFVLPILRGPMFTLVGGVAAIALFAGMLSLLLGDVGNGILIKISDWYVRGMFVAVVVTSVMGIGWNNIMKLFGIGQ